MCRSVDYIIDNCDPYDSEFGMKNIIFLHYNKIHQNLLSYLQLVGCTYKIKNKHIFKAGTKKAGT